MEKTFHEKLIAIQSELKTPKNQMNTFGKYKYRSCEDILESVKPHLKEHGCTLTLSDEIMLIGTRFYVRASAWLSDGKTERVVAAYAREEEEKKGMDGAQITGAASSYARKYALNGLFCIDDTKDSDATNDHAEKPAAKTKKTGDTIASSEQIDTLHGLCKSLGKDFNACMKHYCGEQAFWKPEQAAKAIAELTAAKKSLSNEIDQIS